MKILIGDQSKKIKVYEDQVAKHKQSLDDNKNRYRQRISALQSQINELKKKGGVVDNKDLLSKRNYVSSGRAEKVQKLNQDLAKDAFEEDKLRGTLKGLKARIELLQKDVSIVDELLERSEDDDGGDEAAAAAAIDDHDEEEEELPVESVADVSVEKEEHEKKLSKLRSFVKVKDKNFEKYLKTESEQLDKLLKTLQEELLKAEASLQAKKQNRK